MEQNFGHDGMMVVVVAVVVKDVKEALKYFFLATITDTKT
jgi:hypothetical protein